MGKYFTNKINTNMTDKNTM